MEEIKRRESEGNLEKEVGVFKLLKGDCLEVLKGVPDESVDLILTDPPYGTIKGMEIIKKGKLSTRRNDWDDVVDIDLMMAEFRRVLRVNGKAIIFGNNKYTQELRSRSRTGFKYVYPLYWFKNHFGSPLSAKVSPVSYMEDITVFSKDFGLVSEQREYMRKVFGYIGLSKHEVSEKSGLGFGTVCRMWYTDSQFRLPSESSYKRLEEVFGIERMEGYISHGELKEKFKVRGAVFNLPEGVGHVSNVFEVKKESKTLHATQKPVLLMEKLVEMYSDSGDVVLDAFMGSGTTGVACKNKGRGFIGIEKDEEIYNIACKRLEERVE